MNIYIGNLAYEVTEQDLRDVFSEFGEVTSAKIINDMHSGKSKGFGFVEMATPEEADKAKEMFNNYSFLERPLVVNEAKPQEKKSFGDRGGRTFNKR